MTINFKRLNAMLLTTIMLGSFSLKTTNCYAESTVEDFLITENQAKNNYSYMIEDEYEDSFKEEHIKVYNEAIKALIDRNGSYYLPFDDATNLKICNSIYHSPYNMLFKRVYYDIDTRTINVEYLYDLDKQNEILNYVDVKMDELFKSLFTDDMNLLDKLMVLFGYSEKKFGYLMGYPSEYIKEDGSTLKIPIYYLLKKNAGVCHTYSFFLDYFCQKEGVKSYLTTGWCDTKYHMWNKIQLDDGKYYYFDITSAVRNGKTLSDVFIGFGITNAEYKMYKYKLEDGEEIELNDEFEELRGFKKYEYLGNHIFKLTSKSGRINYYNTETRTLSDSNNKTK